MAAEQLSRVQPGVQQEVFSLAKYALDDRHRQQHQPDCRLLIGVEPPQMILLHVANATIRKLSTGNPLTV